MNKMDINQLRSAFGDKGGKKQEFQSDYYPFWQMPVDSQSTIRFLPDKNDDNPMGFMIEKRMHELNINGQKRKVPCNYMYGEKCPICEASKTFYDSGDEINGKKYWRKQSYVAQALVLDNSVPVKPGEDDPTGKVKLVSVTYSLYKIIKDAFESGELDVPPFFYEGGTDFIIKKDQQGDYPSYVLSNFSRRSTDLDPEVKEFCQENLKDLRECLPKQYTYEKLQAMLDADLTGTPYQEEGSNAPAAQATAPQQEAATSAPQPAATPAPAPVEEAAPVAAETTAPAATEAPAPQPTPSEAPSGDAAARAASVVEAIKRKRQAQEAQG